MGFWVRIVGQLSQNCLLLTAVIVPLLAAEHIWPRGTPPSWESRLRSISYLVVAQFAGLVGVIAIGSALGPVGFKPLFDPHATSLFAMAGIACLTLLVIDFFNYWYHRAQHVLPFLWRFHAVHHSIEDLGAGCSYSHITEPVFRMFLWSVPLSLILAEPTARWAVFLLALQGNYAHSATRLNLGRLAYILGDNRTHRIHHSLDPRHFNCNFGMSSMLWDWLFGTAYFPEPGEWPKTGLDDRREPATLLAFILQPIGLRWRGRAEVREHRHA